MESDQSYSGDSNSTSGSSSGSSDGEEEVLEPVKILGHTLELPQDLCEDYGIFKEFFSMKTWESLEDKHKEHLKAFLPNFSENQEEETETTIRMLFNREPLNFTSPLNDFYNNLKQGNYRPDIAKMKKFLLKARAKQQKHKIKSYYAKLLPEVLISRERLLAAAQAAPPGPVPRLPTLPPKPSKNNYRPPQVRARQRYFEELAAIRGEVGGEVSDDENYPEGPPLPPKRKSKFGAGQSSDGNISGTLGGNDPSSLNSLECLKNVLAAHRARRQYRENHPELNTTGITLDDIRQRVQLVNGAKKLMFGGQKSDNPIQKLRRGPKKENAKQRADAKTTTKVKEETQLENIENKPLLPNIKIKCEQEESDSESSSFVDPVASPKPSKRQRSPDVEIKQEIVDIKYPDNTNFKYMDRKMDCVIKQEPPDVTPLGSKIVQPVPIKLEDLDGIDMMALPVELADDTGEVRPDSPALPPRPSGLDADESLTETTYANFLCLVRALFPARAAHRANKQQLHARCKAVMRSPIAPLNTWYNLSEDWCSELDSALDFLAGERGPHPDDFVPYLQFIPETQMYQWIGAGRDCDALLGRLCERWLRAVSPPPPSSDLPPPRYPTSWVVRSPTNAEISEFRSQERKRFGSAAKPFTYLQHGYKSCVGPCARASVTCSAHSSLLSAERPRHATFMALVRDAVARLPNGEGTSHHILTLLKMSQYVMCTNEQVLHSAVSSALDRLHSAKRDPIVKYDQRSAIWTYLHRHRSEEEWAKSTTSRSRTSAKAAAAPPPPALPPPPPVVREVRPPSPTPHQIHTEMEVAVEEVIENGSDTDVDVDDSSDTSAVPHLSSAQLLRQVTQASQAKQLINQAMAQNKPPKGKLVAAQKKPPATTPMKTHSPKAKATSIPAKMPTPKQAVASAKSPKQNPKTSPPKQNLLSPKYKTTPLNVQVAKQAAQIAKQTAAAQMVKQNVAQKPATPAQNKLNVPLNKPNPVQAKPNIPPQSKVNAVQKPNPVPTKQNVSVQKPAVPGQSPQHKPQSTQLPKTSPHQHLVTTPVTQHKSPLLKQRPLQKQAETQKVEPMCVPSAGKHEVVPSPVTQLASSTPSVQLQMQNKQLAQGTRSLLLRPPAVQTTVTAASPATPVSQVAPPSRRGVVRVLSPAAPSAGKSLISPRALLSQNNPATTKKRASVLNTQPVTTSAQTTATAVTTLVSSAPTVMTSSVPTRTVQLGGRTVQLAANQTVHLPGGQAVQLASGHTLQLSSLQLPTHSVRLPSGQTVQLASPQAVRAVSTTQVKNPSPRAQNTSATIVKPQTSQATVQIPVSTVQLGGQTVQIAGQSLQIGGQSVQLTGHTVKLPSGQSVQVASQSVHLPSGQTVQLATGQNIQTVQLGGQNMLSGGQSVQMRSGQSVQLGPQTVQLAGQTVQLAGGQTVQLPSGQTIQLSSGQTVQLSSGQTLQLSGQTVQLANQAQNQKTVTQHVVRNQTPVEKSAQPIVAKLLTNAQGQMISLEGMMGGARTLQLAGVRPQGQKIQAVQGVGGVRVVSAAGARVTRPLILTAAKPLHNIILQQSDGSAIRVTASGNATTSQAIVLGNIGAQSATTSTTSAPILKLQQVNALQQVKLPQGIKIQQSAQGATVPTSSGVRSVLMDGQQLKLLGGRHVLARLLRPNHPPHQ